MRGDLIVVCSDRGQHGRHELGRLRQGADGAEAVRNRQAPAPWGAGATIGAQEAGGNSLGATTLVPAPETRANHEGRTRFRYTCPACRRDVKWNKDTADLVFAGTAAAGVSTVDVSLLP